MQYKLNLFEQDNEWYWDIESKYDGVEVAGSNVPFATRQEARADGLAALSDFEGESC